jgi:hypothetical protein
MSGAAARPLWSRPAHSLKFQLLFRGQFVLEPDRQFHVQTLNLPLVLQYLVELRQGLLLIHRVLFHRRMQRFHCILELPLQLVETRGSLVDFSAHKRLLIIGELKLALMLHDHLWRKDRITQWITWAARSLWLLRLVRGLRRLWLLRKD